MIYTIQVFYHTPSKHNKGNDFFRKDFRFTNKRDFVKFGKLLNKLKCDYQIDVPETSTFNEAVSILINLPDEKIKLKYLSNQVKLKDIPKKGRR